MEALAKAQLELWALRAEITEIRGTLEVAGIDELTAQEAVFRLVALDSKIQSTISKCSTVLERFPSSGSSSTEDLPTPKTTDSSP